MQVVSMGEWLHLHLHFQRQTVQAVFFLNRLTLKIEALRSIETSENTRPATDHQIPEDLYLIKTAVRISSVALLLVIKVLS